MKKHLFDLSSHVFLLCAVFIFTGCAGVPFKSIYKMMTVNPLEIQPEGLAIAVKRSNVIQLNTGDVIMRFYMRDDVSGKRITEELFPVIDNSASTHSSFPFPLEAGEKVSILQLSDSDVNRLAKLQGRMRAQKANGGSDKGIGFSVQVLGGCRNVDTIPEDVYVSLFLRFDLKNNFFLLYRDFNIGQEDLTPLKNFPEWERCVVN